MPASLPVRLVARVPEVARDEPARPPARCLGRRGPAVSRGGRCSRCAKAEPVTACSHCGGVYCEPCWKKHKRDIDGTWKRLGYGWKKAEKRPLAEVQP